MRACPTALASLDEEEEMADTTLDIVDRLRFTAKDAAFHEFHGNAALMREAAEQLVVLREALLLIRDSTYRDALTLRGIADRELQR